MDKLASPLSPHLGKCLKIADKMPISNRQNYADCVERFDIYRSRKILFNVDGLKESASIFFQDCITRNKPVGWTINGCLDGRNI